MWVYVACVGECVHVYVCVYICMRVCMCCVCVACAYVCVCVARARTHILQCAICALDNSCRGLIIEVN